MSENILIVGHGPSLVEHKMGEAIDSYPFVVKVNRGLDLFGVRHNLERPKAYGTRCDATCLPLWRLVSGTIIKKKYLRNVSECWISPSRLYRELERKRFDRDVARVAEIYNGTIRHAFDEYHHWRKQYRNHKTVYDSRRIISTGMAAILIALETFNPEILTLAGFDNMRDGIKSNPDTMGKSSSHSPDVEHKILGEIEETYNCEIYHIP